MNTIMSQNVRFVLFTAISIFLWVSLNGCRPGTPNEPVDEPLPEKFAGAQKLWRDLLSALKSKDLQKIESLTTANGLDSLNQIVRPDQERLEVFQRLGTNASKVKMTWQTVNAEPGLEPRDGRVYGLIEPWMNSLVTFVKTPQGWKLDGWSPGM